MRTTKRMLGVRLKKLNDLLGTNYRLDYCSPYRCWELAAEDNSIIHACLTSREMLVFLDGLNTGVWMKMGAYQ